MPHLTQSSSMPCLVQGVIQHFSRRMNPGSEATTSGIQDQARQIQSNTETTEFAHVPLSANKLKAQSKNISMTLQPWTYIGIHIKRARMVLTLTEQDHV